MRAAPAAGLLLLGSLALAACQVDTEGAACATPGSTQYCPEGQVCGTGLTCSKAAAACAGGPCTAGAVACRAGSSDVMECSAAGDPACGSWVVKTACTAGVTQCGVPVSGPVDCRCAQFVVDPGGVGTSCRYASIAQAVSEAQSWTVGTVLLGGAPGQTYGQALADAAPIVVPAGMTVAGADVPYAAGNRIIAVQGAGAAEGIRIEAGGSLAGVTVVRGAATAPTLAVRVMGGAASGGNMLESVRVDASGTGGAFATGVRVEGSGAVSLASLGVSGAAATGLEIERSDGAQAVVAADLMADGLAAGAGASLGVNALVGDVTLLRPVIKRWAGTGLLASAGAVGNVRLTIQDGAIHDNFGTGLVAQMLGRLQITGTLVCKNKGGAQRNINGTQRLVGGAFAAGAVPADQAISGSRFFDNDGDQVALGLGSGTWKLDGPSGAQACSVGLNAFAGYTAGSYGLVLASNTTAQFNGWPSGFPTATGNVAVAADVLRIGAATVVIGTESGNTNYCGLPTGMVCPAP